MPTVVSEKYLTYIKAMEFARAMKAADTNTKLLKATEPAIWKLSSRTTWEREVKNT